MGVAEYHHLRFFLGENLLEAFEVHRIERPFAGVVLNQGIFHDHATVALGHQTEGMIDRGLYDNLVTGFGEEVQRVSDAADHTGNERQLAAVGLQTMPVVKPLNDRLPVGVGGCGVTIDAVGETLCQRLFDFRTDIKIHVGYPKREKIVSAEIFLKAVEFHAICPRSVTGNVKIIFCHW